MTRCLRATQISSSFAALTILIIGIIVTVVIIQRKNHVDAIEPNYRPFPIIINTWGFVNATVAGFNTLRSNGSALDAIVAACTKCQDEQCDHTVGWGGSPDENGETTLDAMIMDGPTHSVGSVAALRNVKNVIGVARAVLEHTDHTLLVGDQATAFAVQMGFTKENLTSKWSAEQHTKWLANHCQPNFWHNVTPNASNSCGPYKPLKVKEVTPIERKLHQIDRYNHDTIGVVVIDSVGRIASGTSTNGAKFKIPGRVGDSPIAGAGSYCDQEIGGAAATGDGDIIMRYLVSYQAVENLRQSYSPNDAAEEALSRILKRFPNASVGLVVLDIRKQSYGAACINVEEGFPFMIGSSLEPDGVQRKFVQCIKPNKSTN